MKKIIRKRSQWAWTLRYRMYGPFGFLSRQPPIPLPLNLVWYITVLEKEKKNESIFFKMCILSVTHYVLTVTSKTIKLSKLNCVIFVLIIFQILLLCLMPPSLCNSFDIPAVGLCVSSPGWWQRPPWFGRVDCVTVWVCYSAICF